MDKRLERILPKVQKPARYTGGEYNQIMKNKDEVDLRMAFCFPDTYEIAMSNIGLRILYGVINNMPGVWCERAFAPWGDMREEMKDDPETLKKFNDTYANKDDKKAFFKACKIYSDWAKAQKKAK